MTHVTANVVQQQFRGRNDDGSETAASWKAATNTNWTQPVEQKFRVRVTIAETAGGAANNYSYVLQYNINGTGWTNMGTTGPIHSSPSGFVTNGTPTTQQISTGTFVAGQFDDNSSVSNISLTNQVTEMEYCLLIDAATINNNDTIQLRATNGGTALNGYTATPTITVQKAAPVVYPGTVNGTLAPIAGAFTGNQFTPAPPSTLDITLAAYTGRSLTFPFNLVNANGIHLREDGTLLYAAGDGFVTDGHRYTLATPWDLSTATVDTGELPTIPHTVGDILIDPTGTKLFIPSANTEDVKQYPLTTAWDFDTANLGGGSSFSAFEALSINAIAFRQDGWGFYILDTLGRAVLEYTALTTFNIVGGAYVASKSLATETLSPVGLVFSADGTKLLILDGTGTIYQYTLSTAWVVSTATYDNKSVSVLAQVPVPTDLYLSPDEEHLYVSNDTSPTAVYEFDFSGVGVQTYSGTVAGALAPIAGALTGTHREAQRGTLAGALAPIAGAFTGARLTNYTGTFAGALGEIEGAFTGTRVQGAQTYNGTLGGTLNAIAGAFVGVQDHRAVLIIRADPPLTVPQWWDTWTDTLIEFTGVRGDLPYDTPLELHVRRADGEVAASPFTVQFFDSSTGAVLVFMGSGA